MSRCYNIDVLKFDVRTLFYVELYDEGSLDSIKRLTYKELKTTPLLCHILHVLYLPILDFEWRHNNVHAQSTSSRSSDYW